MPLFPDDDAGYCLGTSVAKLLGRDSGRPGEQKVPPTDRVDAGALGRGLPALVADEQWTVGRIAPIEFEESGRLRLLATICDSAAIEKILRHLNLPVDPPGPAPARSPAWLSEALPGFEDRTDPAGDWPA